MQDIDSDRISAQFCKEGFSSWAEGKQAKQDYDSHRHPEDAGQRCHMVIPASQFQQFGIRGDTEEKYPDPFFDGSAINRDDKSGKGYCLVDFGKLSLAVINLSGKIYLEKSGAECPFKMADELIEKAKNDGAKIIIVDFHAEATSEKRALGLYLDGKVSAIFGTHTHVQTADEQILQNGTGYITDLGMTGPIDSVLGVKKEIIINRLKSNDMSKFELADGECSLNACIFEICEDTGKTVKIERINI